MPGKAGRVKALLLDLDGTVLDTNQLIVKSFQHTLGELLGLTVAAEELYPYFGEPLIHTMARFSPERAEEMVAHYRAFNIAHHDELARVFPGLSEALAQLREGGMRLAIVTSKYSATARRGLDLFGLTPLFETLVTMETTPRHKPDPDPALAALERLDLPPEEAVMVGDSILDVQCGRSAGTGTAVVGWSVFPRAELQASQPDYWLNRPQDLLCFLP
ncbi:MAG: pyrophosphatase PpaX [Bacillota bacterium]